MNKLIKSIGLITIIGALGTACNKQIDTTPDAIKSEYLTFDDVRSARVGTYDALQSASYYQNAAASGSASGWSQLPDLMGDDFVEALESLGNWNAMSDYQFTSSTGVVAGIYSAPYEVIFRANKTIESLPKYETGATLREAQRIKAEMLALRAMAHFDCMRYFAPDFGRNSTSLGVPYMDVAPALPLSTKPSRKTVKENYDAIFADLNQSLVNFRLGGATTGNTARIFIDSTVVYAIRARVAYYAQDWAEVLRCTNVALSLRPIGTAANFIAAFQTSSEATPPTEVYWVIPKDNFLNPGGATNGPSPNYRVANSMRDTIQNINTRFGTNAYTNTGVIRFNVPGQGGVLRTLSYKYNGQRTFKVFRAGEMLLMRAEAKARTSDDAGALADLNLLRTNRSTAVAIPGTETGAELLKSIATFRRIELLSEGHRWFDLKRTTRTFTRAECSVAAGSRATTCSVSATAREWAFPIPFNERKLNENLVQNAGW
jgi:starch-binding outer membrane protein, SusD/RagB family